MTEDSEKSQGGSKNGRKEGLSGSSFFTWFMVIALLGVWTSVAVVWFDLVDYEQVLGKLGIYDADGDGDFDVEDAKVLLGEEPGGIVKKTSKEKDAIQDHPKKVKEKPVTSTKEAKAEEKKKPRERKERAEPKGRKRDTPEKGHKDASTARKERLRAKESKEPVGIKKRLRAQQNKEPDAIKEIPKAKQNKGHDGNSKEKETPKIPTSKNESETNQEGKKSTKGPSRLLEMLRRKLTGKEGP